MGPREAAGVLAMMQGAWPGFAGDDAGAMLWLDYVSRAGDFAPECARLLIESRKFPPTVAEWQDTIRQIRVHAALEAPRALELDGPKADPEKVHALVAGLHDSLRAKADR